MKTKMARIEGTIHRMFTKLSKTDLLIIDDFGLTRLEQQQRMDIMEIIEDRHARNSLIITSQLPVASWYDIIGDDTIADARSEERRVGKECRRRWDAAHPQRQIT